MQATSISAVRGPTPGIVWMRAIRGSSLLIASSFLTTRLSCSVSESRSVSSMSSSPFQSSLGPHWTSGIEFLHGNHAGELGRIIFIGFSFDVGPSPGFFVGGTDEGFQAQRLSQIVDPARGATGFHHDEVNFLAFEDSGELGRIGFRGEESVLASCGVEKAAHGVEFAEVENLHCVFRSRVWWAE